MIKIVYKSMISITISAALIITPVSAVSAEAGNDKGQEKIEEKDQSNRNIKELEVARMKLKSAIYNYNNGDLNASRRDMEISIEWLNKASQNSNIEKSREESRQLAEKIDEFKRKLNQSSEKNENSLMRFLHQSSAIIGREFDQLIHSYVDLATSEKILKHLLDAKMHLYTSEHDLLVSHDIEDSKQELNSVLKYLEKANKVAKSPLQNKIIDLSKKIIVLKEQAKQTQEAWITNDEIMFLNRAKENLIKAKFKATPNIKLQIESIEADIQILQADIEISNIKNNYESAMAALENIINQL